jgi:transcriptional regulator with XRE-family HTH domain
LDASTVNAVENGHRGVQGSTLTKLAETLGVDTRVLAGGALGSDERTRRRLGLPREQRVNLTAGESIDELVSAGRGE